MLLFYFWLNCFRVTFGKNKQTKTNNNNKTSRAEVTEACCHVGHMGQPNRLVSRPGFTQLVLSPHQEQVWPNTRANGTILVALKCFKMQVNPYS